MCLFLSNYQANVLWLPNSIDCFVRKVKKPKGQQTADSDVCQKNSAIYDLFSVSKLLLIFNVQTDFPVTWNCKHGIIESLSWSNSQLLFFSCAINTFCQNRQCTADWSSQSYHCPIRSQFQRSVWRKKETVFKLILPNAPSSTFYKTFSRTACKTTTRWLWCFKFDDCMYHLENGLFPKK